MPEFNKHMTSRILFLFLVFFYLQVGHAQVFSPEIKKERLTIEGKARDGFLTSFDFPQKDVERGWWSYSRNFGRPLNMKGYYQVTIPSVVNSGNVDLELFSRTLGSKSGSRFFLALNHDKVPKEKIADYDGQVKTILQDFKQNYYIEQLEDRLESVEKKAKKVSKKVMKGKGKEKALIELTHYEKEIESIKARLLEVYGAYN